MSYLCELVLMFIYEADIEKAVTDGFMVRTEV